MAGKELELILKDTSSAKTNLADAIEKTKNSIRSKKQIEERMKELRSQIASAAAESASAKAEYEALSAQLASIPDDDDDDESGSNDAMRQAILSSMLAAQQRWQQAEAQKKKYEDEFERKKKELLQVQNALNMLRIRLENLRQMYESLKNRYSREKEKDKGASSRFTSIQGSSRFGLSASPAQQVSDSDVRICTRGEAFCDNQKRIAEGWVDTIDRSLTDGPGRSQGGMERDDR